MIVVGEKNSILIELNRGPSAKGADLIYGNQYRAKRPVMSPTINICRSFLVMADNLMKILCHNCENIWPLQAIKHSNKPY